MHITDSEAASLYSNSMMNETKANVAYRAKVRSTIFTELVGAIASVKRAGGDMYIVNCRLGWIAKEYQPRYTKGQTRMYIAPVVPKGAK